MKQLEHMSRNLKFFSTQFTVFLELCILTDEGNVEIQIFIIENRNKMVITSYVSKSLGFFC